MRSGLYLFFAEHKINCGQQEYKTHEVFPMKGLPQIINRKETENN
jgi:hypothetical protein